MMLSTQERNHSSSSMSSRCFTQHQPWITMNMQRLIGSIRSSLSPISVDLITISSFGCTPNARSSTNPGLRKHSAHSLSSFATIIALTLRRISSHQSLQTTYSSLLSNSLSSSVISRTRVSTISFSLLSARLLVPRTSSVSPSTSAPRALVHARTTDGAHSLAKSWMILRNHHSSISSLNSLTTTFRSQRTLSKTTSSISEVAEQRSSTISSSPMIMERLADGSSPPILPSSSRQPRSNQVRSSSQQSSITSSSLLNHSIRMFSNLLISQCSMSTTWQNTVNQ